MFKLPDLPINWRTQPQLFERYWADSMRRIEQSINGVLELPGLQEAITAAQVASDNAQAAADNAQAAADNADATTEAQRSATSLVNSYIDQLSFVAPLLTVDNLGNVTVATHSRVYGDPSLNPAATVNGASFLVGGLVSGDVIRVYYDDPLRAGGAVSFQATIDPDPVPVQSGVRHSVGSVMVPAAGSNTGNYIQPPGYVLQP